MKKLLLGAMLVAGVGAFAYWMLSDRKDDRNEAYSEVELSEIEKLKHELKRQKKKNKNLQKEFDDQTNKIKELYGGEENDEGETPLLFRVSDDDSDEDDIDNDLDRLYNESSDDDEDAEDERVVVFGINEDSDDDSYYPMNFKEAIESLDDELSYIKDIEGIDEDIVNLIIATHEISVCLLYSYLVECNDTIRANKNVLERYMLYLKDCLDDYIFESVISAYNDVKIFVEAYLEETDEDYVGFLELKKIFGREEIALDDGREKRKARRKRRAEKKEHVNNDNETNDNEETTAESEETLEENDEGKGVVVEEPEKEPVVTEEGDENDE